ncbi:MAG: SAM-dependent methyltransferase [Phycisphaerae bacterium]|nr:SAM-dependent methyltransferase [Phycisphaerae bacterium]
MTSGPKSEFVSRGGDKLAAALDAFAISPAGWACADFGCNVGGFVDCLLKRGAVRVYAIDTGYGALDYRLRKDPRVVVMERTNALHAQLPEPVQLVTIDVAWTKQELILPAAARALAPGGCVITLVKPAYELGPAALRGGRLADDKAAEVLARLRERVAELAPATGLAWAADVPSPVRTAKDNPEFLALLRKAYCMVDSRELFPHPRVES